MCYLFTKTPVSTRATFVICTRNAVHRPSYKITIIMYSCNLVTLVTLLCSFMVCVFENYATETREDYLSKYTALLYMMIAKNPSSHRQRSINTHQSFRSCSTLYPSLFHLHQARGRKLWRKFIFILFLMLSLLFSHFFY